MIGHLLCIMPFWGSVLVAGEPQSRPGERTVFVETVQVGAIRWDAWYGRRDAVGEAVHESLAPPQWRGRLPFYAQLTNQGLLIDGSSQDLIDREIQYAAKAGLEYWAFVTYPADSPLSLGLTRYLTSPLRSKLRFCLITECGRWQDPSFVQRVEDLIAEPGYLTVLEGRPLVYLGFIQPDALRQFPDGQNGFRKVLDTFRTRVRARGILSPYMVIMDGDPKQASAWREILEADAIGCYATGWEEQTISYEQLAANVERFWDKCAATGAPVVPTVMSGWDRRPRVHKPVHWETWQKPGEGLKRYSEAGTPDQIAAHLHRAVQWVLDSPRVAPARTILIYAWNEFDEGGWLAPTISEGDARLRSIKQVLSAPSVSQPAPGKK